MIWHIWFHGNRTPNFLMKVYFSIMFQVVGLSRKKYQIHVSGRDVPAPLVSFEQLRTQYRCRKYLMKNIREAGYTEPTPIQRQAITALLGVRL